MPILLLSVPRVVVARHGSTFIRKNFSRFAVASFLTGVLFTPLAAHPRHHHHFVSVDVMRATTATMTDGTKLHVQIVKMNGHTMVAIPMGDLPDYLHQQIFLPSDQ
jgi:hypothetical protein